VRAAAHALIVLGALLRGELDEHLEVGHLTLGTIVGLRLVLFARALELPLGRVHHVVERLQRVGHHALVRLDLLAQALHLEHQLLQQQLRLQLLLHRGLGAVGARRL